MTRTGGGPAARTPASTPTRGQTSRRPQRGQRRDLRLDGLSRRQSLTNVAAGLRTSYLYRGLDPVQANAVSTGSGASTYSQQLLLGLGLDERFQSYGSTPAGSGAFISDVQGSTVQLEQGLTTEVGYSYPPFGSTGSATTSSPNKFRYTGREASDNTGLYYYRSRYYAPQMSRFLSEDPLGLAVGPNVYAYANNNPVNWKDALGLYPGAGAAGLVAGGSQCGGGGSGAVQNVAAEEDDEKIEDLMDPFAQARTQQFYSTQAQLAQLDPAAPYASSITAPGYAPTQQDVDQVTDALNETIDNIAAEIASGHARLRTHKQDSRIG